MHTLRVLRGCGAHFAQQSAAAPMTPQQYTALSKTAMVKRGPVIAIMTRTIVWRMRASMRNLAESQRVQC
jgi:hypothetical protein